jgi:hypothetical protein
LVGGNHRLVETSCPGIFAIGVRSGPVKHVAASVGEGAGRGGAAWFFGCSARQLVASWGRCAPFHIVSHPLTHLVRRIPRTVSSSTRLERRLLNRSQNPGAASGPFHAHGTPHLTQRRPFTFEYRPKN